MKVTGLITEYNPFHQGHEYHLQESRRLTGADYVVVVMSGDFVQRGAPAILDKRKRAEMALLSGADLVLELPAACALGSAEFFAGGAVSILNGLGVITDLCFGSEQGEIAPFLEIARSLTQESGRYQAILKEGLKKGVSFPQARRDALLACREVDPRAFSLSQEALFSFLRQPNNILGIEYCKALLNAQSPILPHTISRKGNGYHNTSLGEYASASGIRKELLGEPDWIILSVVLPRESYRILQQEYQKSCPVCEDDFSLLLKYRLLLETVESLCQYQDISPALARRIKNLEDEFQSFSSFAALLKTKDITYTRICRCLMHILLNIREIPTVSYARVLGMRKAAAPLLSEISRKGSLPLLLKASDGEKLLTDSARAHFSQDLFASNLYDSVVSQKYSRVCRHDLKKPPVIL